MHQRVLDVIDACGGGGDAATLKGAAAGAMEVGAESPSTVPQGQECGPAAGGGALAGAPLVSPLLDVSEWSERLLAAAKKAHATEAGYGKHEDLKALLAGLRLGPCETSLSRNDSQKLMFALRCQVTDEDKLK